MKPWITVLNGSTIIALQHCCGFNAAPVNCYIDERQNWVCPVCFTIYGAPTPIAEEPSVSMIVEDDDG